MSNEKNNDYMDQGTKVPKEWFDANGILLNQDIPKADEKFKTIRHKITEKLNRLKIPFKN